MNYYGLERSRNCWSLLLPFIKAGLSCSVIEIVRALADIFHITINDVYVKKTKLLDRCTAVTPFLDKLKKAYEQVVERHLR